VQAGVEALEPQDEFWGVSLSNPEQEDKTQMRAFLKFLSNSSKVPAECQAVSGSFCSKEMK
jgi:hypothetical protein